MLEVRNETLFEAAIAPFQDQHGFDHCVVAIKGTFTLAGAEAGSEPKPSAEPVPLCRGDVFFGEPGKSSTRFESELGPKKPGTDVILNAQARAPSGKVKQLDVSLTVGRLHKTVRVFGNRAYFHSTGAWRISEPVPFSEMPLVYERAYGGADTSVGTAGAHPFDDRNDLGVGFVAPRSARDLDGCPLPNLEDPAHPITGPTDRPPVAGFGFLSRHWSPRARLAGTYDDRWRRERCPLLPDDFDLRFLHGAPAELIAQRPLLGGEPVHVDGVAPRPVQFALPRRDFAVETLIRGAESDHRAALDTVVIEPDERRVMLTWRAMIPCGRAFLSIDWVRIREVAP